MSATIDCPKANYQQIDMEYCRNCFFKRLDDDISTTWCRYRIYQNKKKSWINRVKKADEEINVLKKEIIFLYKTGKLNKAHKAEKALSVAEKKKALAIEIYEKNIKVVKIAMEVNKPNFTSIEEFLTSRDILAQSHNLDDEKSVRDFADSIKRKR